MQPAGIRVDAGEHGVHVARQRRRLLQKATQRPHQNLLVPVASLAGLVARAGQGELLERVGEEAQVAGGGALRGLAEDGTEGAGRHRVLVLEVADHEASALPGQGDLPVLELHTVLVAQDRQEDLVEAAGVPLDIEEDGVATRRAVLQHVPPPGVVPAPNGHVVGHDVHQLEEALPAQLGAQLAAPGLAPELLVHPSGVDHVVPVRTSGRGLEVGRRVEVTHAEETEVLGDLRGAGKSPFRPQLDAVGCDSRRPHASTLAPAQVQRPGRLRVGWHPTGSQGPRRVASGLEAGPAPRLGLPQSQPRRRNQAIIPPARARQISQKTGYAQGQSSSGKWWKFIP